MPRLVLSRKGGALHSVPLDTGELTIGSAASNDIVLADGRVSPRHARFVFKDGKVILVDLKSALGTFVNGTALTAPQVLKVGDKVYIGDHTLSVDPDPEFAPFAVVITEKGGPPRVMAFENEEVSIGRIAGNDVVLPKGSVSKRHARIAWQDGDFRVEDLQSTTGTWVNGTRVWGLKIMHEADTITIGDHTWAAHTAAGVPPAFTAARRAVRGGS